MANGVKYSSNVQIEIVHKVLQTSESLYSTVHTTISCDVMQFDISHLRFAPFAIWTTILKLIRSGYRSGSQFNKLI